MIGKYVQGFAAGGLFFLVDGCTFSLLNTTVPDGPLNSSLPNSVNFHNFADRGAHEWQRTQHLPEMAKEIGWFDTIKLGSGTYFVVSDALWLKQLNYVSSYLASNVRTSAPKMSRKWAPGSRETRSARLLLGTPRPWYPGRRNARPQRRCPLNPAELMARALHGLRDDVQHSQALRARLAAPRARKGRARCWERTEGGHLPLVLRRGGAGALKRRRWCSEEEALVLRIGGAMREGESRMLHFPPSVALHSAEQQLQAAERQSARVCPGNWPNPVHHGAWQRGHGFGSASAVRTGTSAPLPRGGPPSEAAGADSNSLYRRRAGVGAGVGAGAGGVFSQ
eukprot:gene13738-biopygen12574